ncbi:HAMP domain-containing sensor histidine kinase [Paenibacillus filicis]|uniref:histidine kinase n=1 Tax=Paenibacillus gyeongsangnamensis TaxID=3388067 RepID=A0ABT4QFC5_9BACL|nr:HAMP domain-containing sensor histidine kinase [Paenibacillus filicis]MCZ8515583.1 HAMP domain-containing sensor histidine kinase [Paenibacillus filicis]
MWAYFRRTNVILFITLQGCFLVILTIIAYGYSYNWQDVFERYQEDQVKVNAFKMIDDIRNEELLTGPFTDEQKAWLNRRATLYGVLIRYGSDRQTIWFDMFSRIENPKVAAIQEYPVVAKGTNRGLLQVAYFKQMDKLDPSFLAYQSMMDRRSALLFGIAALLSIAVSYFISRQLSENWNRLKETAGQIRAGDRDVRVPIRGPEEVRQLAVTLNDLSAELKKQEDWRHHLMEDLTHELRTPMTSMLSQLEAMIDGIYEVDIQWLQQIYDELIRLSRLMTDMEKLSEAEAARFTVHIKRVNMINLAEQVYRNFLPMAKSKDIKLRFMNPNVPCYAEVDRDKMVQVVSNIVSNAVKYTNPGGMITLGVDWRPETTIIYCHDTGIGIGPQDLPYVFNRLYRADKSRSRFSGGVGLGLSIAKALAEAHDGTIELESEVGIGSHFRITVPNVYKS